MSIRITGFYLTYDNDGGSEAFYISGRVFCLDNARTLELHPCSERFSLFRDFEEDNNCLFELSDGKDGFVRDEWKCLHVLYEDETDNMDNRHRILISRGTVEYLMKEIFKPARDTHEKYLKTKPRLGNFELL